MTFLLFSAVGREGIVACSGREGVGWGRLERLSGWCHRCGVLCTFGGWDGERRGGDRFDRRSGFGRGLGQLRGSGRVGF